MLKGENRGYVTFVDDLSAYCAFMVEDKVCTEIAEPWHQPKPIIGAAKADDADGYQMELNEPATPLIHELNNDCLFILFACPWHQPKTKAAKVDPSILDLNDDCLFLIFDYCSEDDLIRLSKTCVRLADLLEKQYSFPNIDKSLHIHCGYLKDDEDDDNVFPFTYPTLIDLHENVRLMGRYLDQVDFEREEEDEITDKAANRYLQEIVQYCTNVKYMKWGAKLRSHHIDVLKPIFKNLNTLVLFGRRLEYLSEEQSDLDPEIDLTKVLPNLKQICLPRSLLKHCSKNSWPSLELMAFVEELGEYGKKFFALNPQIRTFYGVDDNLEAAANHLPNVEQLYIGCRVNVDNSVHFQRFANLTALEFRFAISGDELIELRIFLNNLSNLKMLRKLKIAFSPAQIPTKQQQQGIVSLVKTHRNIERFDLNGFKLNDVTVVDLIRFAVNLKSLHLHKCGIFATKSLIKKIVDVRKCNQENLVKLKLCLDCELGRKLSDLDDLHAIKENGAHLIVNFQDESCALINF